MSAARIILDVAVILVAAQIGAALLERVGQPGVIGEIVAGIALGPTLLGALPGDQFNELFQADTRAVIHGIGQLALALFMFTIGWDLDLSLVRHRERAAALTSIASIVVPFAAGLGLAAYLHSDHAPGIGYWPFALFIGVSLSVTAFPVLARILDETRLTGTATGTLVLSAAAVDDLAGWSLLAVAVAVGASGDAWDYVRIVAETALFIALVLAVVRPLLAWLVADRSPLRQGLVVPCALAGAYVTDAIGIHAVFGAFLVGAVMPRPRGDAAALELRRTVAAAAGLLVPIYFVESGMAVDVPALRAGDLGAFVLILVTACAGKFLGAYAGARAAGVGSRESSAIGVLMNTRGLIEIVVLTVGLDRGLIDDRLFTLFALMAIATTLATTPLLRRIGPLDQPARRSAAGSRPAAPGSTSDIPPAA